MAERLDNGASGLRLQAPAKLNLYLHVRGRRDDGYHELDSLIVFADWGDRIELRPSSALTLEVSGPFAPALTSQGPEHNLVMRAAKKMAALAGQGDGAEMRLHKALPVAAGLGGGSADAAAALRGLAALWNLDVPSSDLTQLALELGADVPACLAGRPTLVGGMGERLQALPELPPLHLVLANPGCELATDKVFAALGGNAPRAVAPWPAPVEAESFVAALIERRNDLEAPARRLVPDIAALLDRLTALPGCLLARMSGSGASCFGLFAEAQAAAAGATQLSHQKPDWWVQTAALNGAGFEPTTAPPVQAYG